MPSSNKPGSILVLPTYNERENLLLLLTAIEALRLHLQVIVVDDNSPDGTGVLADEVAARLPGFVKVIHRPGKLGLGTAYAAGFQQAITDGAEFILTMDADFSHDPCYLPALLDAGNRYDLVIGSRYIPHGGIQGWGWQRKALSWGANALAHLVLGLHARDCTAGFRCYRRQVLEKINPTSIRANGYSYLIEMLYRCQSLGYRVGEIPIVFVDRQRGESKISRDEIIRAGITVLRLARYRFSGAARRSAAVTARNACQS